MQIAITGASGAIGTQLTSSLSQAGHEVVAVARKRRPGALFWDPAANEIDAAGLEGLDAVIHLAGEPIGERRWTPEVKDAIASSRAGATALLASTLANLSHPPKVLLSGSAIGYYGNTADRVANEGSPAGTGFLAEVVSAWEAAAAPAAAAGIRTAFLRTGIVCDPNTGALAKMLPAFKFGLGGRNGPGTQWMSWISMRDEVRAISFLLESPVAGPVNLTAPNPVTNATFTKTLAGVLHRPCTVTPMIGPRLLFGRELADALLLDGQRVDCQVLKSNGFEFLDPHLEGALRAILAHPQTD